MAPSRFTIIAIAVALPFASFAQDATPATPEPVPPAEAPEAAEKPAAPAPGAEATDPNAADPLLPSPLFPPQTEQLSVPPVGDTPPGSLPESGPQTPQLPTLERIYRVGKFVIKYGTDVRKRNPKLPTEEKLAESKVAFLEVEGKLYHVPKGGAAKAAPANGAPSAAATAEQNAKADIDQALHPSSTQGGDKAKPADAKPAANAKTDAAKKKGNAKPDKSPPPETPKPAPPAEKLVSLKVSSFGEPREISAMALQDVYDGIVKTLTDTGIVGVYLVALVNPGAGVDLRKDTADVEVQIFVSEVAKIRTIARKIPFRFGDLPKINDDDAPDGVVVKDPKHLWIKAKSPVKDGGLLEKRRLQDYLSRLNRFPGRRVDSAINATGDTGKVMLDYLIREQRPWMVYVLTTNNGTESTGEWRNRVGAEIRQLANKDDILRLEYTTTDFSGYNSGILSYQFALDKPDVVKMKIYGLYGEYSAQDVGFAGANFKGSSLTAGAAITWTPLYWHGFPLDLTLGAEFLEVTVDNQASALKSTGDFILPYLGIGTERTTDRFSFSTFWQIKGSYHGPDQDNLDGLGRFDTDGEFWFLNGDISASVFLEPLILGKKWGDGKKWWHGILANELAFTAHGQYTLQDHRLVPQLEMIAGGYNTVRGYPESFTAGDSGFVGSVEYRLHVPRLFKPSNLVRKESEAKEAAKEAAKPAKETAKTASTGKKGKAAEKAKPAEKPAEPAPLVTEIATREPFRLRPGTAGSGPDWDFIVRMFADYGQTFNNRAQEVIEVDRSLFSVGAGVEFQLFKPIYMTIRADYAIVLMEQTDLLLNPVNSGDTRLNISATIAW